MTSIETLLDQRSRFLGFIRRRVDSPAAAEDILQTAYVRALQHAPEIPAGESAVAWFYRVLRNAIIDSHRRRAAEDRALNRWAGELNGAAHLHRETERIACGCIASVIPTLRPAYREILEEIDLGGGSLEAFAGRNAITSGNAAVRIHRARQALRKQLVAVCSVCAEHACLDCTCKHPHSSTASEETAEAPLRS